MVGSIINKLDVAFNWLVGSALVVVMTSSRLQALRLPPN
jgi:hypothetical protein